MGEKEFFYCSQAQNNFSPFKICLSTSEASFKYCWKITCFLGLSFSAKIIGLDFWESSAVFELSVSGSASVKASLPKRGCRSEGRFDLP